MTQLYLKYKTDQFLQSTHYNVLCIVITLFTLSVQLIRVVKQYKKCTLTEHDD